MKKSIDLLAAPIDSSLRKFAIPLVFSFIIQNLYTWVDMYYVSRISSTAIAAIKVCEQLIFLLFSIASGFAIGSGVVVARRIGEGNKKRADHTATQSVILMFFIAVIISMVFLFFSPHILDIMRIHGEVAKLANDYLSMVILGLPGTFLIFHINSIVRASGNSIYPMAILITSNIINAILAPLLIFGLGPFPEMGMKGAGLATALAQLLCAAIAIATTMKGITPIKLTFSNVTFDWALIKKITLIGIPATLQLIAVSLNRILITSIANLFGETVLTTYVFGLGVDLFVYMSVFAVGAALEIITGQNLGAEKPERIFKYHKSAIKQLSIIMSILFLIVFFLGRDFSLLFTKDLLLADEIQIYLRIAAFSYIPFAIGVMSIRVISGSGDYYRSFRIIILIFFLIQIPLSLGLSRISFLGHHGIWYGNLISMIVFALVGLYSLYKKKWMKVKV